MEPFMFNNRVHLRYVLLTFLSGIFSIFLTSCGGGGGDGSQGNETTQQTYSLGGRITWAITQGLVLSDGTGNIYSMTTGESGSSYFSFNFGDSYLDLGTPYNVSIVDQPDGLTCTVSNGSGTISDHVDDVLVSCVAPTANILNWSAPIAWSFNTYRGMILFENTLIFNYSSHLYTADLSSPTGGIIQPVIMQNGPGGADLFDSVLPSSLTSDNDGNIYIAYRDNSEPDCKILKLTPTNTSGTYVASALAGTTCGYTDGPGITAQFGDIQGLAVDSDGNVYVADGDNNVIRKITSFGYVTTLAGSGTQDSIDGTGSSASFDFSFGGVSNSLTIDQDNNIYIAENITGKIRKITTDSVVTTIATFNTATPVITTDNEGNIYIVESEGSVMWQTIRKINPSGSITTLVAHGAVALATWSDPIIDEGLGVVNSLAVAPNGNIYTAGVTRLHEIILP
jgi:hypothetical protein